MSIYPTFEQRQEALRGQPREQEFMWGDAYVSALDPPTSEDRLLDLPSGAWQPMQFRDAARQLARNASLQVFLLTRGDIVPPLDSDVHFTYPTYSEVNDRWARGEEVVLATVREGHRVIGYGVAARRKRKSEIEVIDVDESSRRPTGLQDTIEIAGAQFGVGVGHVVVEALLGVLKAPVLVDATTMASRYVFKSLGFERRPNESNPSLLKLVASAPHD